MVAVSESIAQFVGWHAVIMVFTPRVPHRSVSTGGAPPCTASHALAVLQPQALLAHAMLLLLEHPSTQAASAKVSLEQAVGACMDATTICTIFQAPVSCV